MRKYKWTHLKIKAASLGFNYHHCRTRSMCIHKYTKVEKLFSCDSSVAVQAPVGHRDKIQVLADLYSSTGAPQHGFLSVPTELLPHSSHGIQLLLLPFSTLHHHLPLWKLHGKILDSLCYSVYKDQLSDNMNYICNCYSHLTRKEVYSLGLAIRICTALGALIIVLTGMEINS